MKRLLVIFGILVLLTAACSSDDDSSDDSSDDQAADTDSSDDQSSDDSTTTTEAGGCPDETSMEVVNASAEDVDGVEDGPIDVVWTLSEGGPHPDNDVDDDANMGLAFATWEIEPDEQFGVQIPVVAEVPDGEYYFNASLFADGGIEPGMTFIDQLAFDDDPTAADGEINFLTFDYGADRLLPGDLTITITEMDDEVVCGEITTETDTDFQTFIGLEGEFVLDREQALSD